MDSCTDESLHNETSHVRDRTMPIAIVGIGFRGPGDATDVESFYKLISESREAWSPIPQQKWNFEAFYHPDADRNGTSNVKGGHFFKQDLSKFDASFFSMTSAEAASLDPQQRLLLECCYEALENAGIPMNKAVGSKTSVFSGTFGGDYTDTLLRDSEKIPLYQTTNSGHSRAIISNRLSYFFDFKGPSVTIDTACSASLTALHLACQSLRTGETSQAIVTGSSVILSSDLFVSMSAMRFLSPDGRCYSFDSRANGYGRGEGVGCIVLKPLDDALRDNDTIRAVIRNTGVNQDGRTPGISFPSKQAQEELIKTVYETAGLDPLETTYVEAHGTGTQAGDPIETSAISNAIAMDREQPLLIGSVKSNVGHMEGASGVTGIIKCVLMLENGMTLPSRNFEKPNERIPFDNWKLKVATSLEPWHTNGIPRRLSINGFGYGGTNAHAIIEEAKGYLASRNLNGRTQQTFSGLIPSPFVNGYQSNGALVSAISEGQILESSKDASINGTKTHGSIQNKEIPNGVHGNWHSNGHTDGHIANGSAERVPEVDVASVKSQRLYVLSSFDEQSGKQQTSKLRAYLEEREHLIGHNFLDDLAYTLNERRSNHAFRTALRADSLQELTQKLDSESIAFSKTSNKRPTVGFVFTGQGAQWSGMGLELMKFPVFCKSLMQCSDYLKSLGASWDIVDELRKETADSRVDLALLSQPICSAIQISMVDLLKSWGILPASVTGHSSGEIAAAYAIGSLSLEDAMLIAYYRGLVTSRMTENGGSKGAMMAVGLPEEDALSYMLNLKSGRATIACINSPSSVTISGDESAIDELRTILKEQNIFARKLMVEVAYHSHHMTQVGEEYLHAISDIKASDNGNAQFFSSVTGREAQSSDLGPMYWVANLLGQVKFSDSLKELCYYTRDIGRKKRQIASESTVKILVEIGPHSALSGPIKQILKADPKLQRAPISYTSMLTRNQDSVVSALNVVAKLVILGYPVSFPAINRPSALENPQVLVDLPPYAWNHTSSYWAESRISKAYRSRTHPRTDLLGVEDLNSNPLEPRWRNVIRISEIPWVKDHKIQSNIVYPAAGYIVMAIEAAYQRAISRSAKIIGFTLREVIVEKALIIPGQEGEVETMVNLRPYAESIKTASDIWDEFAVYSVTDDNRWTLHCRGLVMVENEKKTSEAVDGFTGHQIGQHPHKQTIADYKSRCTSTVNSKDLYKQLRSLGIDYGSTFENMTSARAAKDRCIGQISIPDIAAVMPMNFQFPFIIHPSTLDSILHPLFAALSHDTGSLQNPMVPMSIEHIYVSSSISNSPGKELTVYAATETKDPRHVKASMLVMNDCSDKGDSVVTIGGITCVALERDVQPTLDNAVESFAYNFHWVPDIDLLTSDSIKQIFTDASHNGSVPEYIKLLGLKNPRISILMLDPSQTSLALAILQTLAGSDGRYTQCAKYHCTYTTDLELRRMQEDLETFNGLITYSKLDQEKGLEMQGLKPGSYDIVLFSDISTALKTKLDEIHSLIKKNGRLILIGDLFSLQGNSVVKKGLDRYMPQAGFGVEYSSDDIVISRKFTVENSQPSGVHIVVEAEDCGVSILHLLHRFWELKIPVSVSTLSNAEPQGKICIMMSELSRSFLQDSTPNEFEIIKKILLQASGVLWVTRGASNVKPDSNLITGLMRTVRSENGENPLLTLDLDEAYRINDIKVAEKIIHIFEKVFIEQQFGPEIDVEYRERGGVLEIPRVLQDLRVNEFVSSITHKAMPRLEEFHQSDRPLRMEIGTPGLLDTIHFVDEESLEEPLAEDFILAEVKASGFNFRDVMMATGQTQVEKFGGEFSGVVTRVGNRVADIRVGDHVAGLHLGTFCTHVKARSFLVQKLPENMAFETGATLPVAYCTAYYSLFKVANIQPSESVLVHAASGGLGQAVIELCRTVGSEIFATVGSLEKKQLLIDRFHIAEDHIFYSRDRSFADNVMRMTDRKGVDVIINSLAGETLRLTWNCIAPFGRFIELGKRDLIRNTRLEMVNFSNNVSFTAVDLMDLTSRKPEAVGRIWAETMQLLRNASIRPPFPITTYSVSNVDEALAKMHSGKHMGKLILVSQPDDRVKVLPREKRKNLFRADGSYLLVGGLKGLVGAIGHWMVSNGALNLIFASRSGLARPETRDVVKKLRNAGARVEVLSCDVSDADQLRALLTDISTILPPIRGVIQGAMVLQDNMFGNMTHEEFRAALRPKHAGTWNLHKMLPHDMDFFIMLSSVSGIIGNASQANYAAGNTFLDVFASYRNSLGLPAVTLDLGVILGVGYVAENQELAKGMERQGFQGTNEEELMALIRFGIESSLLLDSAQSQIITGLGVWKEGALQALESPIFSHFRKLHHQSQGDYTTEPALSQTIGNALREVKTIEEAAVKICDAVMKKAAALLMVAIETIAPSKSLASYGMDSLVAVELRNWIFREIDCTIPILELLANDTLSHLGSKIAKRSRLVDQSIPEK